MQNATIPSILVDRIRGRAALNMLLIAGASVLIAIAAQISVPLPHRQRLHRQRHRRERNRNGDLRGEGDQQARADDRQETHLHAVEHQTRAKDCRNRHFIRLHSFSLPAPGSPEAG